MCSTRRIRNAQIPRAIRRWHLLGSTLVLGVVIVLTLMAVGVARHPSSLQGVGNRLLWLDVALLLAYGIAALWVQFQGSAGVHVAIRLGTIAGLLLGAVFVANHVIELFVPARNFALVISPVLLTLALLGATGSAATERTGSLLLAVAAGVWCAMVGTLVLLCVGFVLGLTLESRVEQWLREAFAASGMNDPGGFLVQNTLEAASEALVRMPAVALFLSLFGALASAWIAKQSRNAVLVTIYSAPLVFIGGAAALWYANSLPRAARPPFILAGVLLASVALSAAHPIWSVLRHRFSG
jgi:hypothetical protein